MDDWGELENALAGLRAAGSVEVREDGEWLAELSGLRCEVRREGKYPLIHLWSEECNLVRRVLCIAERSLDHISLEVQRFGRSKPGRLEFVCAEAPRPAGRLAREKFRARFRQILTERFPDERVESLTTSPDLEHSFSASYARGVLQRGQQAWAVMGVSASEGPATIDAILSFGLLWLHWTREHADRRGVEGLRLVLPEGAGATTVHRLQALGPSANVELYELQESTWGLRRIDPRDAGNVATWLTPRREVEETLADARDFIQRIRALAREAIDAVVPPGTREVAVRFRGLEFARWRHGRVSCGLPDERRALAESTWDAVVKLVKQLDTHRAPFAQDTNHPLYRAQAERWLETLVLADPARIDARLDPQRIYPQVPAFSAGDRGVIDLLGVTRDGRLVVLELKVTEDIPLVLQAADYWLRVCWHHRQGDFPRYGYFPGVELQPRPPLLSLVAPGFRFHPVTDVLLRYLSSEVEVTRIGLNENWRRGLRVVFRQ